MHNGTVVAGYLFTFTAAAFWALLGPLGRLPLSHGISPLEVGFWRAFFGACFFLTHGLLTRQYRVGKADGAALAGFGVIGVAVFFSVYQLAVQKSGAAMASILLYTAPFWVALFSRLFFKERLTRLKLAALIVAMTGVSLVCLSGGGLPQKTDLVGVLAGLLSGLAYSTHYVYAGVYLKKISAITLYMYCLPVGALVLLPFVEFAPKSAGDWLALVGLGFFSTYAAYTAYCAGIKRLAPTKVAVLCNIEPLLAAFLAFAFWGELFPASGWFGTIMVMAAVFMIMADKKG